MSLQYLHMYFPCKYNSESLKLAKTQGLVIFISNIFSTYFVHFYLVFTKTVNNIYEQTKHSHEKELYWTCLRSYETTFIRLGDL